MNTKKILESEVESLKISSLPNRPTAKKIHGGGGLSAQEMKAAFDSLPIFVAERLNSLIDDIESAGDGKISESIKTGLDTGHCLSDFFADVKNGNLASYMALGDGTLVEKIHEMSAAIDAIKAKLGMG